MIADYDDYYSLTGYARRFVRDPMREIDGWLSQKSTIAAIADWEMRNGNEHFREVRIAPLTSDPNRTLLVEISRDTTITSTSVKELSKYNLRLALCLEQSAQKLWELDLNTHNFSIFDPHQGALGAVSRTYHFPDEFVSKGIVHPDSLASFRLFSRKLLGGEKHGGGAFILKSFNDREQETGAYAWYSVSFRMMFGSDGLPTRAVGILSSLDPISTQPRFIVYGRLWEYLLSSLYAYVQVNLTASQVDKVWLTGKNLTYAVSSMNYQDFMDFSSRRVFSFDSREKVNSLLNRDGLLKLYRDGQTWVTCDVDLVESGAYIRPVTLHVLLTEDDSQDNVYGFFFLQYTDKVSVVAAVRAADAASFAAGAVDFLGGRVACSEGEEYLFPFPTIG